MPNWVKNIVRTSEDTMKNIKEKYFTDGILDFNKIVPMPKSLELTSGSITEMSIFYAFTKKGETEKKEIIKLLKSKEEFIYGNYWEEIKHYYHLGHFKNIEETAKKYIPEAVAKELNIKTLEELGDVYISNLKQYGSTTWYDWCIENWGTKWGVSRFSCNENTMIFETAWSIPENIFDKLALEFPEDTIEVSYADEDYSSENNGILTYHNGSCEYDTNLDEDFISEVWCEEIKNSEISKDITDDMFE